MKCWRCQAEASPRAQQCERCGALLPVGYTPPYLGEKLLTARSAVEGERKHVTVLFCDLVGSTSIAGRIGPDAMHELLDGFFGLALEEVHRFEGTINQFLGDGFMALFGAPVAHEDDARRAVLAASSILRRLPDVRTGADIPALAARFGINSGLVVVGAIGDDLRLDYTAMGETTHVAARLQALAEPGTIVIGESTHRALREEFDCQSLGARAVKGIAEPLVVYRLAALKGATQQQRAAFPNRALKAVATPFIGRQAELDTLRAWARRAAEGSGGVVCVAGEPGIGKSRLLAEAESASDPGPLWLHAHGVSFGNHISYLPFVEMLRGLLGIPEERSLDAWATMQRKAGDISEGPVDWLPYLGALLGVEMPGEVKSVLAQVDNEGMGRQIFAACRRLFARLCRKQPVILILDDYQWFDASSTRLVEHLLPLVHAMPFSLFVASRNGSATLERLRAVLMRRHAGAFAELFIGAHSQGESVQLVRQLVDDDPQVHRLILEKAAGSPFFIEEVIRALADTGVLVPADSGRWRVARAVHQPIAIPDGIQGVIAARIDRLDDDLKHVLKLAAVVGRSFLYKVLGAIAEAAGDLDRRLGKLDHLHLVRERRRLPELEYVFTHALVQEVTYDSILVRRRKLLHLRVAQCLEQLFAERIEEFYGLLAYHYTRAEDWKRAHEFLVLAGDHSARMAADSEALTNYKEALTAYERAFGGEWDPLQRATLARKMGEALFRRGEFDDAARHLQHALVVLGARPVARSRAGVRLAILAEGVCQLVLLLKAPGRKQLPTDAKERYRIYEVMGWIDFFVDPERMFLDTLYALHSAQANDLVAEAAQAQAGVAVALDMLPWPHAAAFYIRRATRDAKRSDHPRALAYAYFATGIHAHFIEGRFTEAAAQFERSVGAYRQIGEVRGAGAAASCWVHGRLLTGELELCRSRSEAEAAIAADTGDRQVRAWFEGHLMYLRFLRGESIDEVVCQADRGLALFQAIPDYASLAQTKALISLCYLARGQRSTALRVAELTLAILREHSARGPIVPYVLGWLADSAIAVLAARVGNRASPEEERTAATIGETLLRQGRRTREGEVCGLRWRGAVAWANGRQRRAKRQWDEALQAAEALGAEFESARTWLDIGRFSGDRDALARAETLFGAMGAVAKASEARGLSVRNA